MPALGAAGAAAAGLVAVSVLRHPLVAAFAGAAPLHPSVLLVCGSQPG